MVAWRIEPAFLAHMEARTTGILQTKTRNTYDDPTDLTSDAQCGMCPQTSLNVHDRQTLTKENLFLPFEVHHPTQHQTARPHPAAKMSAETKATKSEHDTARGLSTNKHTSPTLLPTEFGTNASHFVSQPANHEIDQESDTGDLQYCHTVNMAPMQSATTAGEAQSSWKSEETGSSRQFTIAAS